jgi:hypothetical protein
MESPEQISRTAMTTAVAVDLMTQGLLMDDGTPYTVESATALVLKTRKEAGLAVPELPELMAALAFLKDQPERE